MLGSSGAEYRKGVKKTQVAMRSIETRRRVRVLSSSVRSHKDRSYDQELVIEGAVKALGVHHGNKLTIARSATVKADVHARIVTIEGTIEGDVVADELVHLARSANVIGSITAPSVTLEEGADFGGRMNFRTISRASSGGDAAMGAGTTGGRISVSVAPDVSNRHRGIAGGAPASPSVQSEPESLSAA